MMASFSVFGGDFPFIALIVLHTLKGSVIWSSVSTNCLHVFLRCLVVLVITSFICSRTGEISGSEDGLALLGSLVGESQLRIPKLEPDIILSNRVPLVAVRRVVCFEVSQYYGIRRHHQMKVTSCA